MDRIIQPHEVKSLRISNREIDQVFELQPAGPVLMNVGQRNYDIFCMYSLSASTIGCANVDPQNFGFGDSFVIILDSQKFVNRVKRTAEKLGVSLDCHLVEYFDPETHSGEVGPFRKPSSFEFQHEFRIIITPGTIEPVKLKVRTLKDITTPIWPLSEINKLLRFNTAPAVS